MDTYFWTARGWHAVFADRREAYMDEEISRQILQGLAIAEEKGDIRLGAGEAVRHWKWGRIIAMVLFAVLAILPVFWFRRCSPESAANSSRHTPRL
jgi:hypothetical protein